MFRLLEMTDPCKYCRQKFNICISKFTFCHTSYVRQKSHYDALGLDSTATAKDIKTAYYEMSLKFHPDKNKGSQESVDKFREISEAYEVLSNPEKKTKYDQETDFNPPYSNSYKDTASFYRASWPRKTYTGRTRDFNYDEHYKQHYANLKKQREIEYEYFRRRWEADFYQRYPTMEHYYKNRHKYREEKETFGDIRKLKIKRTIRVILSVWLLFFFFQVYQEWLNPERKCVKPSKMYYKVQESVDNSEHK